MDPLGYITLMYPTYCPLKDGGTLAYYRLDSELLFPYGPMGILGPRSGPVKIQGVQTPKNETRGASSDFKQRQLLKQTTRACTKALCWHKLAT